MKSTEVKGLLTAGSLELGVAPPFMTVVQPSERILSWVHAHVFGFFRVLRMYLIPVLMASSSLWAEM